MTIHTVEEDSITCRWFKNSALETAVFSSAELVSDEPLKPSSRKERLESARRIAFLLYSSGMSKQNFLELLPDEPVEDN